VPGTAALNTGGGAVIASVSCASAGNCTAAGRYSASCNGTRCFQALVVSEAGGTWGQAEEVPGTAAFDQGGETLINSVSCASAGNCSAGGSYTDGTDHYQPFVVSQVGGAWQPAEPVAVAGAVRSGDAVVVSVSCGLAGNCGAGGFYTDGAGHQQAFVVSEVGGTWQRAEEVPGTAALNQSGSARVSSVSCGSAGNCGAGGYYTDGAGHKQALVVSEISGAWQRAEEVPGTAALNQIGIGPLSQGGQAVGAEVSSLSCASAGNCSAGGDYQDRAGTPQVFVVSEVSGTWQQAEEVPGAGALNHNGAAINSVSCASAGNCSAGGHYQNGSFHLQAFVISEVGGTWQRAEEVPGTAALNLGTPAGVPSSPYGAEVNSVSCGSAGNCSAGGYYDDASRGTEAFVVSEVGGTWQRAEEVPGTAAVNQSGMAQVSSVSCASAGDCSAGGYYVDGSSNQQAFVVVAGR
jgi:hypothetical protein